MHKTDDLGHGFWTCLVPQISHSSFIVRAAIISAATVLDGTQSQSQNPATQIELHERHRLNVRSVIRSAERIDPEFALLASLIFASCELVMGALDAGMLHLEAGSKVLKERITYLNRNGLYRGLAASMLLEHILPIFTAYNQVTSLYGIELPSMGEPNTRWAGQYDCVPIPTVFVTTDQAHAHLRSTIHQIFVKHSLQSSADFEHLQTQLDQWTTALNALVRYQDPNHTPHVKTSTMCLLRNQHRLAQVFLSVVSSGEEANPLVFEKYSFDFVWILAQYESMKFEKVLANESVELISPLFIIATLTRNKTIRNEAVRLLKAIDRIEANWDSQTAFRIAQNLIAHEECSDLLAAPGSRQIRLPTSLNTSLHKASGMWVSTDFPWCTSCNLTVF